VFGALEIDPPPLHSAASGLRGNLQQLDQRNRVLEHRTEDGVGGKRGPLFSGASWWSCALEGMCRPFSPWMSSMEGGAWSLAASICHPLDGGDLGVCRRGAEAPPPVRRPASEALSEWFRRSIVSLDALPGGEVVGQRSGAGAAARARGGRKERGDGEKRGSRVCAFFV
jgi:hypothetical protein